MSQQPAPEYEERAWSAIPDPGAGGKSPGASMPRYPTPLIGREADRERLCGLLLEQGQRMVVITGSGGIGKTRLAVEVTRDLESAYRHGARFLSFVAVPPNTDLDAAFAWHLGLRDMHHQSYRESIRQYLQFREQLLVIDNIEHLPELSGLLVFIQQACERVSMIVTSRSELEIYGELIHQLDPLQVRSRHALLPDVRAGDVRESPAVRLLVERVRAVAEDFDLTNKNAPVIASICETLGGVPLALELIAPRLAVTKPEQLLAELQETMGRPPGQARDPLDPAVSVQQTMRLSYDQLDSTQQWLFRVLSMMYGQWSIDDVLPLLTPEVDELDAIELIEALVSRSLLSSPTGPVGDVRFTINPVLQHFGRGMLAENGEHHAVADRHASRMVALAEEAEPEFTGKYQQEWLARIDALYEDFRHAHEHLRHSGRSVDALRLASDLWRYAYTRGHYRELRRWIETSLEAVDDHDALRARAFNGIGFLANMTSDNEGTRRAHQRALELSAPLGLHREIAVSRIGLADVAASVDNDTEAALHHLELAADAYSHLPEPRGQAAVLTNRGNIQWYAGDLDGAYATHEQARVLYEQADDARGVAWSDTNTGRIAAQQGRHEDAVPRLLAALDGYLALGDAFGIAEILEALTGVAIALGDLERSSMLAGAAVRLRAAYDVPLKSPDLEEFQAALEAAQKCPRHHEAFACGQELSPEETIALARSVSVWTDDGAAEPRGIDTQQIAHERFRITAREHEVLLLVDTGMTDQQIAAQLGLSRRTVQTYIGALLRKLKVSSRVSAVRAAHEAGILPRAGRSSA